ncbi:MAG: hypothetical protein OXH99_08080 [Bryobacterales bacterium]|nr:hypothetical protein [Bryobacterales bacterium]
MDPAVSQRKFDREIAEFRSQANEYGRRGWFLAEAEFPCALVILATAKTQPISIMCGVWFDYSNYDAAPPSVRLVHPLTREPYRWSELPTRLPKSVPPPDAGQAAQPMPPGIVLAVQQPYMQAHGDDDVPFLCVAGVREYHEHPAHSGDHWESHRPLGAGRLVRLVAVISKYGLETINGFEVQMQPMIRFSFGAAPE